MSIWDRFRRRPKPRPEMDEWWEAPGPEVTETSIGGVEMARRLLYDSRIRVPEEVLQAAGYPKQSPDVAEMSRRESNRRLEELEDFDTLVYLLSDLLVQSVGLYAAKESGMDDEDEEVSSALLVRMVEARGVVISVLSNLIDMGVIQTTGTTVLEGFDE